MTATLYGDLRAAGVPLDHHESDLYCEDTPAARAILAKYPQEHANAKRFVNYSDGSVSWWLDVPFAWVPFWEAVAEREHNRIA